MTRGAAGGQQLARGVVLQQAVQVVRLVGGLFVLTLLARRLTLPEFGTYALLLSIGTYVVFVRQSIVNAAVIGVSRARSAQEVGIVASTGIAIYGALGALAAIALLAVGLAVLPLLNVPGGLEDDARIAIAGMALITLVGWPMQIFDDLLRGLQRFVAVSVVEGLAMLVYVAGMTVMALADAPVWTLVTWNAGIPFLQGVICLAVLPLAKVRVPVSPRHVHREEMKRFSGLSGLLLLGGAASLVTYSLDRAILSAFRSPAAVGLYEAPLQAQNIVRYFHGVLAQPIVPVASRLHAHGDTAALAELFVRALRYAVAATVPLVVVLVCLPGEIITVWFGEEFASMSQETAVFAAWWFVGATTGVVGTTLLAAGHARLLAVNSWLIAITNLVVTLALTSELGIWGPIIGTITALAVGLVRLAPVALRVAGVPWSVVLRQALLPAYATAAGLAAVLLAVRALTDDRGLAFVLVVGVTAPLAYWLAYWALWLGRDERQFLLSLVRRNAT